MLGFPRSFRPNGTTCCHELAERLISRFASPAINVRPHLALSSTSKLWTRLAAVQQLVGVKGRIENVAPICWQWLDLGPGVPDIREAARRIGLIADAYGLVKRGELIPAILWWQDRCWLGIETATTAGDPAMRRLVSDRTHVR